MRGTGNILFSKHALLLNCLQGNCQLTLHLDNTKIYTNQGTKHACFSSSCDWRSEVFFFASRSVASDLASSSWWSTSQRSRCSFNLR